MEKPTCKQLFNEELKSVARESDDSWRHGCRIREVFVRESDNTFWQADYDLSTDGETNGLREGYAKIFQVEPYQVSVTRYRSTPPKHINNVRE